MIGSRKNVSEADRNVLLFSRPLCRAPEERAGLPRLSNNSSLSLPKAPLGDGPLQLQSHLFICPYEPFQNHQVVSIVVKVYQKRDKLL